MAVLVDVVVAVVAAVAVISTTDDVEIIVTGDNAQALTTRCHLLSKQQCIAKNSLQRQSPKSRVMRIGNQCHYQFRITI